MQHIAPAQTDYAQSIRKINTLHDNAVNRDDFAVAAAKQPLADGQDRCKNYSALYAPFR